MRNPTAILSASVTSAFSFIERLNKELLAVLKSPDIVQQFKDRGIDTSPLPPAEYAKFIRDEEAKWLPVIRKSNIRP